MVDYRRKFQDKKPGRWERTIYGKGLSPWRQKVCTGAVRCRVHQTVRPAYPTEGVYPHQALWHPEQLSQKDCRPGTSERPGQTKACGKRAPAAPQVPGLQERKPYYRRDLHSSRTARSLAGADKKTDKQA